MTQVPEIPKEPRSIEDEVPPSETDAGKRNGIVPEQPQPETGPAPADRFGALQQSALNRWNVRDRDG